MEDLDSLSVVDGHGAYKANRDGRVTSIAFPVPVDRVDSTQLHLGDRVGETDSGVVVMTDVYASRAGNRCVGQEEVFVRAFSLPERRQVLAVVAGSCQDGFPAGDPVATWLGGDRFRIEAAHPRTYKIEGQSIRLER